MPRLASLRATFRDLNPRATWVLGRRAGGLGRFLAFGRVQLDLDGRATVRCPIARCRIGSPVRWGATPRGAVTVLTVGAGGVLDLDGATIGKGAALVVGTGATLAIGSGTFVNDGATIEAVARVVIGRRCAIGWGVSILDADGHGLGPPPHHAPVVLGDDVWVGCRALILKGVTIGAGSVVAAGSVVTRSCPSASLLAGVPARVIRSDVRWTDPARSLAEG